MANKKIQATATLFLDTKDAQNDAKKFVNDLKQKLSEVETAADKMTVFKDMVAYIAQVDRALSALRKNNKDAFNSMFDGLDINLKQQLEGLFGVNGAQLGQVDALREKLNTLTLKSSIKEIRTFAKEINTLFTSIGVSAPFDNINEQFSGRTNTGHIQVLATSLANFATVWEDLSARVSQGFGGAGGSGSGVFGGFSNEVQEEIDKLKKQKEEYQQVIDAINKKPIKINITAENDAEELEKLINAYREIQKKTTSSDFTSLSFEEQNKLLAERVRLATLLKNTSDHIIDNDGSEDAFTMATTGEGMRAIESAEAFLDDFASKMQSKSDQIQKIYKDLIAGIEVELNQLSIDGFNIEPTRASITNAVKMMTEANRIMGELDYDSPNMDLLDNQLDSIIDKIKTLAATEEQVLQLDELLGDNRDAPEDILDELCNILSVNIPRSAEKAKDAIDNIAGSNNQPSKQNISILAKQLQEIYNISRQIGDNEIGFAVDIDGAAYFVQSADHMVKVADEASVAVRALNENLTILGHTHPNGGGLFSAGDYRSAISQKRSGMNMPVVAVGSNAASLLNLDGVDENTLDQIERVLDRFKDSDDAVGPSVVKELQNILSNNGFVDALQVVDISNGMDELSEALLKLSMNAIEVQTPLQKLQSLIQYYSGNKLGANNVSQFADEWKEFESGAKSAAEVFDSVMHKLGATDLEGNYFNTSEKEYENLSTSLNMIKPSAEAAGNAIDQAKNKLEEFLSFADKMQHENLYGSAENNVDIGKYLERLETAKTELEALGAQGLITAEDLEKVNLAFAEATSHLEAETSHYDSFYSGGSSFDYYDDYKLEQSKNEDLENELARKEERIAELESDLRLSDEASQRILDEKFELQFENETLKQRAEKYKIDEEELEILRQENASLEEKLSLLQDISEEYANNVTQRDRNRYEELADKEMDAGLTSKEEERYFDLGDKISEADDQLNRFGETYDKIILKLANGKNIEILPDDAGLRKFDKIANEYYQGEYNGWDIEDVLFVRKQEQVAIETNNQALQEQLNLEKQINDEVKSDDREIIRDKDVDYVGDTTINTEIAQLELLQQKLFEVKTAVDAKTQAFEEEYVTVDGVVDAEIASLQSLITQLQEVVAQINLINDGFNNINTNAPKVELKSAQVEQSSVDNENPYYLTDPRGNRKIMYRGVNGAMTGLVSNRYHGGTFFTDLMSLAKRYAGMNGKVETANISMKNPLEIDVDGHQWNDIEYLGNGADEASKKIRQCRKELDELSEWALQNIDIKVNLLTDKGFDEFEQEINEMISNDWSDDDQLSKIQRDKFNGYLEKARKTRQEYLDISNADSNVYGLHDTNRFVELAKNSGYDGVIFKNIKDGTNEISNIVVTLQENQIHFIETLKTNFESLLTDFIGHFGKIEDFLSHYNQFKTDGSLFPEIDDDGRDIFREQLEKYEELSILGEPEIINEFLNKNKILGAYDKRVPGGLDDLFALDDVDDRIDAIVSFYLNAIYELEKIQEAFNTKATSVEQYQREQSGNLTSYDKVSTVKSGYNDKALNDRESYKYADAAIEDLDAKKDQAIAAANAFKELFANLDIETANPEQLKKVVDSFVSAIKLIDDAQSMATGIVENSIGIPDSNAMRDFHELGPIRDSLTTDHLDILQAEAKQIEQIEIDALNAQEQRLKSEQESVDIISKKTQVDAVPDANVQEEISQLNQLKATLDEVKNAILAKTKAFVDEGDVVGQVVGKEVSALIKLAETVDSIVPKVNALSTKMASIGPIDFVTKKDGGVTESGTTTEDKFKTRVDSKKGSMTKYINDLKDVQYVTDATRDELIGLRDALDTVKTPKDLNDIVAKFEKLQTEIGILKASFERTGLNDIQNTERSLLGSFNTLSIDQKRELEPERDAVIKQLETYKNAVLNGQKVELQAIEDTVKALREKIEVYKQVNKEANNAGSAQKNNSKFGDTVSRNATAKYNSLMGSVNSDQFANSKEVAAIVGEYEKAYKAMITFRNELRNSDGAVSEADEVEFKRLTTECNEYAKALDKLIKSTMKLKGNKANPNDYMLGSDFVDNAQGRKQALTDFVKSVYDIDVAAEDFRKDWNEVVFAVDNGDDTFTQMTARLTDARNEIIALAGDTKKIQGKFESFIDGVKNRLQSLSQYFIATVGIYDVWNVIKQGINHVREIDTALTELKKVTDETDASYAQFLQDMSKTGSVIGATVKDLTTMAADWSRLGYSMEEAGKLAESTAVLLNVSEFKDATEASEALISTMQAFQYTADESGHVVDILNEVGNNFAVSSDGLAIALQDSASALMEGGNNLEQAVALVASANKVVQDPNSVGSALRTISLRLRGTSVEVLEEMGEETDGVAESTSKLQEKLKALTGVDIVDMNGAYKDTYTILKEIGSVWKDLDPMDQAAALELMAGKNRANTLAAILNNMKDLEGAYNDAIKAEGSALKENQAYLDSIQGRIDLFNNSVQTMWMNLLDTDVIKGVVNLGTEFIQFLDSSAGRVTALGAALSILGKVLKISPVVSSANGQLQILGKTVETIKNNFAQLSEQSTGAFGKIKSAFASVFTDPSAGKIDLSGMLSEDSFNEKLNGLISGFNNIDQSINAISWDDYVNGVSKSDQAMGAALKTCTSHNGTIIAGTNAYQAYTGAATTAAVGTSTVGGAAQATTGKLIAMKVAALAANAALTMGLSLIISLAIKGVTAWANAGEAAREAAQDAVNASEELREQNESLKDYKDQIRELRTELDNNTLSESEAYDAREKLLTIQNELIDKFGLERDGINLVTGAIEDQIAAIDALSQKDAQQWLNNNQKSINEAIGFFDSSVKGGYLDSIGTITSITNWGVTSNVSDMIREYADNPDNSHIEVGTTINGIGQDINFTGSAEEVKTQVEDFQDWLGTKETELQKELTGLTSMPASERTDDIKNKIESLKKDIEQLQDVREDIGTEYTNWFGENSTYSANKALLEETQYNTAITKYAEQYGDILDAQTKLAEAQAKGDKDGIKSAIETINFETTAAATIAEANGESYMASFFNGIQSEYEKLSNEIKFETDLFENILFGDSGKGVRDVLSEVLSGLEGMNAKEILQLGEIDPNNTAFVSLNQIAQSYGMTIEELCNSLVKLKYIQSGFGTETESNVVHLSAKTYSELTEEVESYNNILSQTSEIVSDNTEVTQEYKDSLKALGISEEELGECFDENNGLIVKNASALRKLVTQKKKDKQATVQQAKSMSQLQYKNTVQQLQQVVKAMAVEVRASGLVSSAALKTSASLREQIEALKQTIQQYALLEISLSDAANAYSEFEAAKERDAQLTYGDSMIEMLQTINESFKTGQVGTEAFQYAVKVIVPESEYAHIDNIEQRMIAIHDYIDKNPLFADWFTIDEGEFSITLDNINSFIDDAFGAGLFTNDSSGDFFLTEAIKNAQDPLKEFADQLGKAFNTEVTEGSVLAMLSELEKYDASWGNILTDLTTTPIDRAINDATTALEEALTAQEEFIRSGGDLNSDKYIELEEAVSAARGALDNASQAAIDNAQTYTQVEAVLKGMTGEVKYTQEQADALARSLGLINENGHIQIDTDTGALILTQEQLDALNERLTGLSEPTILDVQLAYDEIDRQLQELNTYLSDPSNYSGTILTELSITNEGEAKAKVDELTADRDAIELVYNITTTSTAQEDGTFEKLTTWEANGVQITISGDASAFDATVSTVNAVEMEEKDVIITADPTEANTNIDSVDNNNIDDKKPGIYMQGVSVALNDIYSIDYALDTLPSTKDVYVNVHYRENGAVRVNGTAHVDGTAYSNGNLGAPRTEVALTGELGPEMVVRDGRWFTVGENGAEFTQIKKGDIIFNHKQTEDLLSKGYVTSRGKAYASGTIPNTNSGTAYYKTFGGYAGDNDVFENGSANWMDPWTNSFSGAADDLSDAADSMSDAADDSEQVVDFIEMKLEEIEAIIEKTTSRIENYLDDTTSINSKDELYDKLVKAEKDKADVYLKAAQKYSVQAAAALSGVPQQYQAMARNGSIDIKEFLGEDQVEIAEKIQEYRDWAAKADEAENGHLEAIAAISEHRVEQLEDIATDFENIVSISKSHSDLLQAEMDFIEESGNRLSESYYEELKKHSQKQLSDMQNERVALQKILDDAVAAGDVIIGSDDWYSMLETIYEVDQEIIDCKTNLEEFQNAINDLYWDNFDKLIENLDNVDSELSSLYDLISDDDNIVDDIGNWTADGYTALGLLVQQMEVAQQKSKEYGDAISKLKKDYKDGLYSTDEYNEKLAELTDGQYDAIKSYEDAKDAIIDLNKTRVDAVKDGIEKEIDAYEELISKKKESLDADKDARDFERSVEESNKSISDVERKIASLKGNTSSSAIAERRHLEEELRKLQQEREDLFYDESVENQQEALDKELENFQDAKNKEIENLEEYLENQEKVLQDSFAIVQENTQQIAGKLVEIAEDYGVTISDTVATPWIKGANAIGTYEEQLNTSVSATTKNLETLKVHLENLQAQADKTAGSIVAATHSTVIGTNDGHQTSIKGYAKGSNGVEYDQWAILDELGDELQLVPNKAGRLDYIKKGTAILNNTLTEKLINLAMDPTSMLENSRPVVGVPGVTTTNNISIDMHIAEVVHIDHADNNSISDVTKAVKTQMDNYMRDINNKLRRK